MRARSLDPLVKTRVFGMTRLRREFMFRKLHHYQISRQQYISGRIQ